MPQGRTPAAFAVETGYIRNHRSLQELVMPRIGQGVLAIWNGIAPEAEAEFVAWHVREHIPERVGLPGFLRGRRYVGDAEAHPRYF